MGKLLRRAAACIAMGALSGAVFAADLGERHRWEIEVDLGLPSVDSDLVTWTEGGLGKLRFPSSDSGLNGNRLVLDYRGQMAKTLWVHAALDYLDAPSSGVDFTELYLDFKPVPRSPNEHGFRFGAFYPPFSLENGDTGWASPFTTSFSAINAWLGEEIRPIGAEWSLRRRLGVSPNELRLFAGGFYGNDPAGTFLFWRGFSVNDRQTRLNDRLPMPPGPTFDANGTFTGLAPNQVEPIAEIDHEPGYYAGVEWRYSHRALLQLAVWDNRADPNAYRDGQWAWETAFHQLAAQFSLTPTLGLVTQWMRGSTKWLIRVTRSGLTTPVTELARDDFDSRFLLLTKQIGEHHRLSIRYDRFKTTRREVFTSDDGDAFTLGYEYAPSEKMTVGLEYLTIDSSRDIWEMFYGAPRDATEKQLRLQFNLRLRALTADR